MIVEHHGFKITVGPSRNPGRRHEHVARVFRPSKVDPALDEFIGETRALSSDLASKSAKRALDEYIANGEETWPA